MVLHILKRERAALPLVFMMICAIALAQEEFEGLSDPMRPYDSPVRALDSAQTAPAAVSSTLLLQSIVIGAQERYAMINGQRVGVGSMVDDAYIEDIFPRHVVLVRNARREVLPLLSAGADGKALVRKEAGHD